MSGKKVLICPLNWGLGHAARCIPIAREFIRQGYTVDFASDGPALDLLKKEFPTARFYELTGYNITYPTRNILLNVGRKLVSFLKAVRQENLEVEKIVQLEGYDILVSDNRFGCYAQAAYNIFISHQVNILTPGGVLDPAVNAFNHYYIRKYNECWIPDFPEQEGLTGKLGHEHNLEHARYIGPVSRFASTTKNHKFHLIAILSGPEPQRTIWERQLWDQLADLPYPVALVSGQVSEESTKSIHGNITHFNFLTSQELNRLLDESNIVVCRGGYTTIMDLVAVQKKAICIPTPGQTEQEYLTSFHEEKKYFLRQVQNKMDLKAALERLPEYTGVPFRIKPELLANAIHGLEKRVKI